MRCKDSSGSIAPIATRQHARDAFNDFSKLVRGYPNSQYATDAYKRMVFLKDRPAKYELSVVDYYTDRGAWVAVVNRVDGMLRSYPDTQGDSRCATENGKRLPPDANERSRADKVAKIIAANGKKYLIVFQISKRQP